MKILFIQQDVFKKYGVMVLSALIKKAGHQSDILIDFLEKDPMKKIKEINPDIIAFSLVSTRLVWMKNLAEKIKSKFNKLILVGGPHATFFPEIINEEFVDIVCIGEGEYALLQLLDNLKKNKSIKKIKNLWVKIKGKIYKNPVRPLIENLDELPYADRNLYNKYSLLKNQNKDDFAASRGCPYNCTFCFNKKYNELYKGKGKVLRRRSVESLIEEIKHAIRVNRKINHIQFHDDNFTLGPKEWFDEFFKKYRKEINLPFSVNARADLLNEDIIRKLKWAGCNSIRMGIESANPHLREKILRKEISNKEILKASRLIKKYKIKLQVYNILGIPGETLETAFQTYELAYNIKPEHAWCSLMQPYPGTEIMEIAKKQNFIEGDYSFEDLDSSYFSTLPLNIKNKNQICNLQKLFQVGNILRIPKSIMKVLISLPPNRIYELVFKVNFALGIKKLDNLSWRYLIGVALHSKHFFRREGKKL